MRSRSPRAGLRSAPGRWVIGLHSVREALRVRPRAVAELQIKQGWESSEDLRKLVELSREAPRVQPEPVLAKLGSGHQGVAVRVTEDPELDWAALAAAPEARVLVADGVQDPHNLGAIIRTAWLLGAKAVFVPEHRASPITPTVMKVASGGGEHVPVLSGNLLDFGKQLKDMGFWLYGLSGGGRQSLWRTNFPEKVALVVGGEERGIRTPIERLCDEILSIPQARAEASYNASVAVAIALAEVSRQHAQSP